MVDKPLNLTDDCSDCRHQNFAKTDSKLLQLGFQNGELTAEVILHDGSHLFSDTVVTVDLIRTSANRAFQLLNIRRRSIHQRKEAGHCILADQRLCRRCLFRFRHLRKCHTAVCENVVQLTHRAVLIGGCDLHFAEGITTELDLACKGGHDRTERRTGLRTLDTAVCHQTDCLRSIFTRKTQCTCHRCAVFEGFTHHADVRVRIGRCRCQHISKMTAVGSR